MLRLFLFQLMYQCIISIFFFFWFNYIIFKRDSEKWHKNWYQPDLTHKINLTERVQFLKKISYFWHFFPGRYHYFLSIYLLIVVADSSSHHSWLVALWILCPLNGADWFLFQWLFGAPRHTTAMNLIHHCIVQCFRL